jgi:hypothetical protein
LKGFDGLLIALSLLQEVNVTRGALMKQVGEKAYDDGGLLA